MSGSEDDIIWRSLLAEQIKENGRLFYRLAYCVVKDPQAAEDLCQQAFLKAWERRLEIRDRASLRSWLARVVMNDGLQLVRRRRNEKRVLRLTRSGEASNDGSPLDDLALRESVLQALLSLPEQERIVVGLRLIEGMSGNAVGELLGCSEVQVSMRLRAGVAQLRGLLSHWREVGRGQGAGDGMNCESAQEMMMEMGWSVQQRERAQAMLVHLDGCEPCREAAAEFEMLREILASSRYVRPSGGWDGFEQRLGRCVAAAPSPQRRRWVPLAAAMAASFLLGVLMVETVRRAGDGGSGAPPMVASSEPSPQPVFDADGLMRQARAFREISTAFDGQASWLLLTDGQVEMGLSPRSTASDGLLLVRLTMSRNGAIESQADLAIVPGESAILTIPGHHRTLRYSIGTSRTEPDRLTIWTDVLVSQNGPAIATLATDLLAPPSEQVTAGRMLTASGAFELNVAMLRADAPGGRS